MTAESERALPARPGVDPIEFDFFVSSLLQLDPVIERPKYGAIGSRFGFEAIRYGRSLLIDVRYMTPQTEERLDNILTPLTIEAELYREKNPTSMPVVVLACSGALSPTLRSHAESLGSQLWDGLYLRAWAGRLGIAAPVFLASEDESAEDISGLGPRYNYALVERLQSIESGRGGWPAYEKLCEDLLNLLFVPPLNPAIPQSRDGSRANRRDYVLPNYALDGGFWQFMRTHYHAHIVVAEVKNMRDRPGKNEILQVANYLNPHGTGLFGLILARKELNETARWICREQWVQHNKLIVGLHDDDVRQMVETKLAGNDPAELIRQKIEDFRLAI